jgi:hypothetical protein
MFFNMGLINYSRPQIRETLVAREDFDISRAGIKTKEVVNLMAEV